MMADTQIHLAPAHPCMGWVSMNRYWQALMTEAAGNADVRSLLQASPVEAPAWPRWQRQWMKQIWYPWQVRRQVRSGILHVLDHSFAHLLRGIQRPVKTVVTVHDLIPLTDPADLSEGQRKRFQQTVSNVIQADRVVCVSEYTRSEVHRLLQVPEAKLRVLPNGTSTLPVADKELSQKLSAFPPYILSVGGARPRKNLQLLPALVAHLKHAGVQVVIVRVGAALDEALAANIRQHATLHEFGAVNDAKLSACYAHAALTLVPSKQEGFGLPVLEAMQAGCPVIYSLATSLPEVAGSAGLGFHPEDAKQAADQCLRVLRDASVRDELVKSGLERASLFSWKAHWQGLREIYQELLD